MSLHCIWYRTRFRLLVYYLRILAMHVSPYACNSKASYAAAVARVRNRDGLSLWVQLIIQLQESYKFIEIVRFAKTKQTLHQHPHQVIPGTALMKILALHLYK